MAASMRSFRFSCIYVRQFDKLYKLCAVQRQIHNSVRTASYNSGMDPRKLKFKPIRVNKEPKILAKLLLGSKKRAITDLPQEESEETEFNFRVKSENPRKKHTSRGRAEHLSNVFAEYVMSMIASGEAAPELLGKGIEFSKINLKHDTGVLQLHWIASGSSLRDDEIQQLLEQSKGKIRYGLSNYRFVGHVPEIEFFRDHSQSNFNEMNELLQNADKGPKEEENIEAQRVENKAPAVPLSSSASLPLRDRINLDFSKLPLSMKNLGKDQLNYVELDDSQQQQQVQTSEGQSKKDIFGVNREEMIMIIRKKLRSKMTISEMTQWNEEEASRFKKSFAKMKKLDQLKPKGNNDRVVVAPAAAGHVLSTTLPTEADDEDDWIDDDKDGSDRRD